jgi:ATPase family associated with various cellular activities (AAA)
MLTWARQIAGNEIALHSSGSSTLDSDQLAWATAIVLTFDSDFNSDLSKQNFINCALKCLFEHQTNDGNWRTGRQLFHYKNAGNAHCYIFETFTVLLKSALTTKKEGPFIRNAFSPYIKNLLRLSNYAAATQIRISESDVFFWSSGHRANSKEAECWATASVYSFLQCFRRLLGIWTREAAAQNLRVDTTRQSSVKAVENIVKRGNTWTAKNEYTAGHQLMALYVNPIRFFNSEDQLEPDSQPIAKNQARAAILFGPPGTSKTTLARSVASAVAWDYVEIHASHFVAAGVPNVQRTADKIFSELMQLDRTVILFDEIDELVRSRDEADSFGRFLTTSMLPKLAQLWDRRKVIYFVATNHIKFFDPAIRRAQRFDTLINVSPPSFKVKLRELLECLEGRIHKVEVRGTQVENALEKLRKFCEQKADEDRKANEKRSDSLDLPAECVLAKFLLIRWDQIPELASLIKKRISDPAAGILTTELLAKALSELAEPSLAKCHAFIDYIESRHYQQYDFKKLNVWEISGKIPKQFKHHVTPSSRNTSKYLLTSTIGFADFGELSPNCTIASPGFVRFQSA